ncbi:uncharacterized protein LOC131293358 [Anopheles ziemanni]|uniref:uncharacterized protein LOC131264194 n=1 Tax=Anopheles coustani TaxID=139045 RepID=UPI002658F67B|nr:uncharacterized protein LOC131264194 [Anopheles coustani]XP_058177421.1 uncharacterized protein LOC131293358 [Anopheles ziemanni]
MRRSTLSATATTWEQDFEDYVTKRVEVFLKSDLPKRIAWLNTLLEDPTFSGRQYADPVQKLKVPISKLEKSKKANVSNIKLSSQQVMEDETRCDALSSVNVKGSTLIVELRLKIEPCIQTLKTDCNLLNTWISVMEEGKKLDVKPKRQHRHGIGKSIRKETMMEIQFLEMEVNAAYDQMCQHKVKYSTIKSKEDKCFKNHYRQVAKMDEKEYLRKLENRLRIIRYRCWMLYDSVSEKPDFF